MIAKTDFSNSVMTTSFGRNGSIKTKAVDITCYPGATTINITPISSRGMAANCHIEIPSADIGAFIKTLKLVQKEIKKDV